MVESRAFPLCLRMGLALNCCSLSAGRGHFHSHPGYLLLQEGQIILVSAARRDTHGNETAPTRPETDSHLPPRPCGVYVEKLDCVGHQGTDLCDTPVY